MKATDITTDNLKLKVVCYGSSGTGKSRFISTFPKPIYIYDCDDGMLTLRGKEGIEFDTYQDGWREGVRFKSGWNTLLDNLNDQGKQNYPFTTYAIDSFTLLSDLCIREMGALNKHPKIPQWEDYGKAVEPMKFLFNILRRIPRNIIITAHEEMVKDGLEGRISYIPAAMGKQLSPLLELLFDEVYRMEVLNDAGVRNFRMHTIKGEHTHAKSRLGCLEPMEIPDYQVIMAKVAKEGGKK